MKVRTSVFFATTVLLVSLTFAGDARMVVVPGKDLSGTVFKRLGLPNQTYCWEQCVEEARCTGVRWGVVAGSTAGQCQLLSGELKVIEPHEIKTQDAQQITVVASRKEGSSLLPDGRHSSP
jgi:PAN domain-containing protein